MLQSKYTAAIVQWQNAALWQRMSWVRNPLAAPNFSLSSSSGKLCLAHRKPPRLLRAALARIPSHLRRNLGLGLSHLEARLLPARHSREKVPRVLRLPTQLCRGQLHLPRPADREDARRLARRTPPNFRFSFKAPQRITHFKRLHDCDADLAQFVAALEPLRQSGKLGLLLFQLPPNFEADPAASRPSSLTSALPAGSARSPSSSATSPGSPKRSTPSFAPHNAALCIAESDDLATPEVHTAATHTCFRLRRTGGYSPPRSTPSPSASPPLPASATSTSTSSTRTSPPAHSTPPPSSQSRRQVAS